KPVSGKTRKPARIASARKWWPIKCKCLVAMAVPIPELARIPLLMANPLPSQRVVEARAKQWANSMIPLLRWTTTFLLTEGAEPGATPCGALRPDHSLGLAEVRAPSNHRIQDKRNERND